MKVEEVRKWIGKDSCIHWDDPDSASPDPGMGGVVAKVELDAVDSKMWLEVDWGYGVLVEAITHIHLAGEPCPK